MSAKSSTKFVPKTIQRSQASAQAATTSSSSNSSTHSLVTVTAADLAMSQSANTTPPLNVGLAGAAANVPNSSSSSSLAASYPSAAAAATAVATSLNVESVNGGNSISDDRYFHFTSYANLLEIVRSNHLRPSGMPAVGGMADASFGPGVYVTRLSPFSVKFEDILENNWGVQRSNINAAVELNLAGIEVEECPADGRDIHLIPLRSNTSPFSSIVLGIYVLDILLEDAIYDFTRQGFLNHYEAPVAASSSSSSSSSSLLPSAHSSSSPPSVFSCSLEHGYWLELAAGKPTFSNYADDWAELLLQIGNIVQTRPLDDYTVDEMIKYLQFLVQFCMSLTNQSQPPDMLPPANIENTTNEQQENNPNDHDSKESGQDDTYTEYVADVSDSDVSGAASSNSFSVLDDEKVNNDSNGYRQHRGRGGRSRGFRSPQSFGGRAGHGRGRGRGRGGRGRGSRGGRGRYYAQAAPITSSITSGVFQSLGYQFDFPNASRGKSVCRWSLSHFCLRLRILLADFFTMRAVSASKSAENDGDPAAWHTSLNYVRAALNELTLAQLQYDRRYAIAVQFDRVTAMFGDHWVEAISNLDIQFSHWSNRHNTVNDSLLRRRSYLQSVLSPQWQDRDAVKARWGEDRWKNNPAPKGEFAKRRKRDEKELRVIEQVLNELTELQEQARIAALRANEMKQNLNEGR